MITTRMSTRGKVLIPEELRERSGLKRGGYVIVGARAGEIFIRPLPDFLSLKGAIPKGKANFNEARDGALKKMAKETARLK